MKKNDIRQNLSKHYMEPQDSRGKTLKNTTSMHN